jgi:hypothetical protein
MFGINIIKDVKDSQPDDYALAYMLRLVLGIMEKKGLLHLLPDHITDYWVAVREKK